jgi:hypothetical protein
MPGGRPTCCLLSLRLPGGSPAPPIGACTLLNDTFALTLEVCWNMALIPTYTPQSTSKPPASPKTLDTR